MRFGLCCLFLEEPIKFRTTTASSVAKLSRKKAKAKLSQLCLANAEALMDALVFCKNNKIGCFRVNSQILPLKTHPDTGYDAKDLPDGKQIIESFRKCGEFAKAHDLRTTFHPDQFVVLNSPRDEVVQSSIAELEYQAEVAEWIGADVINIHGGGMYGDKESALSRFKKNFKQLSRSVKQRLTLENDDKLYTPADLQPVCEQLGIPLVYDIHHHRCNGDNWTETEATNIAIETWNREPLFHISSPRDGWRGPQPNRHHDYINVRDFPTFWDTLDLTVEVEAKAKELAVSKLSRAVERRIKRTQNAA